MEKVGFGLPYPYRHFDRNWETASMRSNMRNRIPKTSVTSLRGQLLVASPQMDNSLFTQTVVLMIQHNEEGAFGVVLNRPTNQSLKDVWTKLSDKPCKADRPLNFGGPVPGPLLAVHTRKSLAEASLPQGIYLAAEKDHLEKLVRHKKYPLRMFVGCAGWSKGQLEQELEVGAWLHTQAKREYVFSDPDELWQTVLHEIGRTFLTDVLKIEHIPDDPSLN